MLIVAVSAGNVIINSRSLLFNTILKNEKCKIKSLNILLKQISEKSIQKEWQKQG